MGEVCTNLFPASILARWILSGLEHRRREKWNVASRFHSIACLGSTTTTGSGWISAASGTQGSSQRTPSQQEESQVGILSLVFLYLHSELNKYLPFRLFPPILAMLPLNLFWSIFQTLLSRFSTQLSTAVVSSATCAATLSFQWCTLVTFVYVLDTLSFVPLRNINFIVSPHCFHFALSRWLPEGHPGDPWSSCGGTA